MNQLYQIANQIGIDSSFFSILAIFTVLHVFLSKVYLLPYRRLLERRNLMTQGSIKVAEDLNAKAGVLAEEYNKKMAHSLSRSRAIVAEAEAEAKKEEGRIISESLAKSKGIFTDTQRQLASERKLILDSLSGKLTGLANEVAEKLIGRHLYTSNGEGGSK